VEFLHVLKAGIGAPPAEGPAAALASAPEAHTITLEEGGRAFTIRLARTGPRGGSIRVAAGGRTLLQEPLPEAVEDHWRHYRDDPRFRTWVTDPRYRIVIEPDEEDRKLLR